VRNPSWDKSTDYKPAYLDEIDNPRGNDTRRRQISPARHDPTATSRRRKALKQASTSMKDQLARPSGGGR
jgi:peptide/nickel transport system substrate-binding protein